MLSEILKSHSKIVSYIFVCFLWITATIMFILILLGVYKIVEGVLFEFIIIKGNGLPKESGSMILILEGLELIFVSPLVYLLILSLTKYISSAKPEVEASAPSEPILESKKVLMKFAMIEIMNVKILSVSLFISILILYSISYIIKSEPAHAPIFFAIALMLFLVGYYFLLDTLIERLRKPSDK